MKKMFARQPLYALCLVCLVFLSACAGRGAMSPDEPVIQGSVKDLATFPQDLTVYAKGKDKPLLSTDEHAAQDARFNRIYFGPWDLTKARINPRDFKKTFGTPRGYRGTTAWTQTDWNNLKDNADIPRYPSRADTAITLRQTSLRELPTAAPRYTKPTPNPVSNPFDMFQYSALPPGMPLFITHQTRDKQWYFVENPIAAGWVSVEDVAPVSPYFIAQYRTNRYAALVRDNVLLTAENGTTLGRAHIGAVFPIADGMTVFAPVRGAGNQVTVVRVPLSPAQAVVKPLPLTPARIATVGNQMMGQPYGWGGMYEYRDCSSTTRDLFTPFGLWLPRNSSAQARVGRFDSIEGLDGPTKEAAILRSGVPFLSLIWMRGHIGLYLGEYKGKAAMFHSMWGLRVENGEDSRHVVGRTVVTSLEPGREIPNVNTTLRDRMRGISTIGL